MERENCNSEPKNVMSPLRMMVSQIVRQTYEEGNPFQESGVHIKGEIDTFISCHRSMLPQYLPVGPNYRLNSETVMLERVESQKKAVVSSTLGWFELKPQQVINLVKDFEKEQQKLYEVWFTHSGIILNSIERNLTIDKTKKTFT